MGKLIHSTVGILLWASTGLSACVPAPRSIVSVNSGFEALRGDFTFEVDDADDVDGVDGIAGSRSAMISALRIGLVSRGLVENPQSNQRLSVTIAYRSAYSSVAALAANESQAELLSTGRKRGLLDCAEATVLRAVVSGHQQSGAALKVAAEVTTCAPAEGDLLRLADVLASKLTRNNRT